MTPQEVITRITAATSPAQLFDFNNWQQQYKDFSKVIHPDICHLPDADTAMAKLNTFKAELEFGKMIKDDAGDVTCFHDRCEFSGDLILLKRSLDNYNKIRLLRDSTALHFQKYMPIHMELVDGKLIAHFQQRAVPLSDMTLSQEHVNWVLSRLLEYTAWLEEAGLVHCGLNPESVFVIPENHGLQVCSFYHMAPAGSRVKTISGRYQNWYPANLFTDKLADNSIDILLDKKIAICLLGDRSGSGVKFRKTNNEAFMDFVIGTDTNAHEAFVRYRKLLHNNFEKKFHSLFI